MRSHDKINLAKFAMDPDHESTDAEDFIDFDFGNDNETYQFTDQDINELEDMLWKD